MCMTVITILSFRAGVRPEQVDERVGDGAAPTQSVVPANELLVVHVVSLCEKHITESTGRLEDVAPFAVAIQLERARLEVETHWKFSADEKLFRQPIRLCRPIDFSLRHVSGVATYSVAVSAVVVRRPPEGTRLTDHIAEHLRMS